MALHSSLRLAWQAFCCLAVAMVSTGAALQCLLAPSVLGVSWVENAVIPLIFSVGGGIHPAATPVSVLAQINTVPDSSSRAARQQRGFLFGVGHASSI